MPSNEVNATISHDEVEPHCHQPIEVRGWASDNHSISDVAAVIVNPQASALDLLSWGIGQLQQCNAVLDALCGAQDASHQHHRVIHALLHFSEQAESVLEAGLAQLRPA